MRKVIIICVLVVTHYSPLATQAQDIPPTTEQQLESQAEIDQGETEDDAFAQQLRHFKKHPLDLNVATVNDLEEIIFLTDLQIDNLVSYRKILGRLISIYELQAVPGWDLGTIKKILPYISISDLAAAEKELKTRFREGDHRLLIRYSQTVEKSQGFQKSKAGNGYLGSRERIFFRYGYQCKNLLQYGIVGDKDAGEQFFNGTQKFGFDFYSAHLFARKLGKIESLAVGDFTVNMGQGLIQWQGLAFKKSADVMATKRQSSVLRPYNSAGEFYFHRGLGITVKLGRIKITSYVSIRKLSANVRLDTMLNSKFITSFLNSGYHRTPGENQDRNNVRQFSFGGNLVYTRSNWHVGINGVSYNFSLPVQKRDEPYNLFSISGRTWKNFSVDYSWTFHNLHVFGEGAIDKNLNKAFVNGVLLSIDPRVDLSLLQRSISSAYQAVYANAFTENSYPTNENGYYAGISFHLVTGWRLGLYADFYKFPWLKYLVDAPSYGKDFLIQLDYAPNRKVEIFSRYRTEAKELNQRDNYFASDPLTQVTRAGWRTQVNYRVSRSITLRNRIELVWYEKKQPNAEEGFLTFFDVLYAPSLKPFSANVRLAFFDTDDYNSRIYAYENDVLYSYSVPAFSDEGYRYYVNLNYDLKKNLSFWLHWTQMIFCNKKVVGSGLDEIKYSHRSDIRLQCEWSF